MTADPGAHRFPAPGSSVPGAPPPLKRPLTPADGIDDPAVPPAARSSVAREASDAPLPTAGAGSGLVAAAAMVGVAVGLELSRFFAPKAGTRRMRSARH
jgi:hypothetical protein